MRELAVAIQNENEKVSIIETILNFLKIEFLQCICMIMISQMIYIYCLMMEQWIGNML